MWNVIILIGVPDQQQQCFASEANDSRLSLEMSLRLQVQRKLEAERLRAMERLRHAEAGGYLCATPKQFDLKEKNRI